MFEKLKQLLKIKESEKGPQTPPGEGSATTRAPVVDPQAAAPASVIPAVKSGGAPTPHPPVKATKVVPKKGKHGLAVLSADQDLAAMFDAEGPHDIPPPPKPTPRTLPAPAAPRPVKKAKRRNRHGILVIDDEKDLFLQMAQEAEREGDRVLPTVGKQVAGGAIPPLRKVQKDRHGLPILEQGQVMPASDESDEFAALLAASLSEKSREVLLHEKVDKGGPARPIPLKERLKRYPAPQGQLDLHGYTAAKADQTAEHYVRRAFSSGTYTLRLIVGKGLHSEHGAVLPDTISDRVAALKEEGIVLAWEWEKGKKAKSGSILVYLNNYDTSRHGR